METQPRRTFQTAWLTDSEFVSWIEKGPDSYKAKCKPCNKIIDLQAMGRRALTSHANGKRHTSICRGGKAQSKLSFTSSFASAVSNKEPGTVDAEVRLLIFLVEHNIYL